MSAPTFERLAACRPLGAVVGAALLSLAVASAASEPAARSLDALRSAGEQAQALLQQGVTGERTQALQQEIVDGLDALIAAYRTQGGAVVPLPPKEGQPKVLQQSATTGVPQKPARESVLPVGEWQAGRTRPPEALAEAWTPKLPEAERKKIEDAFRTGRLPRRYEDLLREYNKRLAEEGGGPG